jgi:hypothetical protein
MNPLIQTKNPVRSQSGGNGHGIVLAREVSSDTPRLLIAATRLFYVPTK